MIIGYQKTKLLCFVTDQLAVFCSQNGHFTFVSCENKTEVYLTNVNKYKQSLKTFGDALSFRVAGQNFVFSREFCYRCW